MIQGAFDGTLFPRHFNTKDNFLVYRKAFCRKIAIEYSHTAKIKDIEAHWYKPTINTFDDKIDDPESMCYCSEDKTCLKRGLGNIKPCYYSEYSY
jgi:scavenger receptor class B, member 1